MARCLRCKAGNEWIEGDVRVPRDGSLLALTEKQAFFLRSILSTHVKVTESETARICAAILKKLNRPIDI